MKNDLRDLLGFEFSSPEWNRSQPVRRQPVDRVDQVRTGLENAIIKILCQKFPEHEKLTFGIDRFLILEPKLMK